jgi:hypothetical protein
MCFASFMLDDVPAAERACRYRCNIRWKAKEAGATQ